jgi:hypothetical protein
MILKKGNFIIFTVLIIYWLTLSYFYLQQLDPSPSILIQQHTVPENNHINLIAGNKISQEIISKFDNLGIISIRFQTYKKSNNDTLIFRLKEKGGLSWYYVAQYHTDQFQDHQLFPFGFPVITNSKGKTFIVEIESSQGTKTDRVMIDNLLPSLISKYKFHIQNINLLTPAIYKYIIQKIINIVSIMALLYPIILYLFPLLLFLTLHVLSKFSKRICYLSIIFPSIFLLFREPLFLPQPPFWTITILVLWIIYVLKNNLSPKINLAAALVIVLFLLTQIIQNNIIQAETYSLWLFFFLGIAIIQYKIVSFYKIKTIDIDKYFFSLFHSKK